MQITLMLAIIFGGTILALAIIGSTILMGIKIIKGGVSRKSRKLQSDETRMIQEIYHGLLRMEKRVESLETIILDHDRKGRSS
ncbi:MAG: phage-shock protein [Deltaproteobacteria bacterium]|nr:phage-shock protein [Deltaproteobacteria bacterium]